MTGELAHQLKGDDATLETLGSFDGCAILAAGRKIVAQQLDTGKILWERPFPESIAGKVASLRKPLSMSGRNRSSFGSTPAAGEIARGAGIQGKAGPLVGMVLRGKTLFGTSLAEAIPPVN